MLRFLRKQVALRKAYRELKKHNKLLGRETMVSKKDIGIITVFGL